MHRILTGSLSGVLLVLACALPGAAPAATLAPPAAIVRIEGAATTLLPQTTVQTTSATQIRGKACPGSSAAGALELATQGNWSGSYSSQFHDYSVTTIMGESHPFTGPDYWTLWINGRSSSKGACSSALAVGDHELWFDCQPDASFNCKNNPLALSVPATVRRGRRITATVVQLDGAGHSRPIAGAAVSGDGVAAVSGSDGRATLVPTRAGAVTLQAAKSGATPSDPVSLCVYATRVQTCGTAAAGPPVHVIGITQHQVFAHGPQQLRGTAGPDPSGLTDVSLSLLRHAANGSCSYYDATRGSWRAIGCHAKTPSFSVGVGASWSYRLPATLAAGTYRLDVVARNGNGVRTKLVAGVSQLDFSVKHA